MLTGSLAVSAALALMVGPLSDRVGRRGFLLVYESVLMLAATTALFTSQPYLLTIAALLGGFGRGANGAAGPFSPVEQSWLAQGLAPAERGRAFSINVASGFLGMGLGAGLAAVPSFLGHWLPGPLAYRPLFAIVLAGSLVCVIFIFKAKDAPVERSPAAPAPEDREAVAAAAAAEVVDAALTKQENRLLTRLVLANAVNGIGIGLTGPLMAYWFALRFGIGPAEIGPLMGVSFVLGALSALSTGRLTRRFGLVRSVVGMRLVGLASLVALPLAPTLPLAAGLYMLRSVFNRGTAGARQALSISLVRPRRRGTAASINTVSLQIPRAISPIFSGLLYDAGLLALPFLIAAGFQCAYLFLYYRGFRNHDPGLPGPRRDGEELEQG